MAFACEASFIAVKVWGGGKKLRMQRIFKWNVKINEITFYYCVGGNPRGVKCMANPQYFSIPHIPSEHTYTTFSSILRVLVQSAFSLKNEKSLHTDAKWLLQGWNVWPAPIIFSLPTFHSNTHTLFFQPF